MRQIRSSGSVKAISLDRDEVLRRLREVAAEALETFPELRQIRVIGSLATGTQTGTSDVDLLLQVADFPAHPLEAMKPYYLFFSRRLNVGLDMLLIGPVPPPELGGMLRESLLVAAREDAACL